MLYKNISNQKVMIYAHNILTNIPADGEAANITAAIAKDGGSFNALSGANVMAKVSGNFGKGCYSIDLAQSETNANQVLISAVCSTVGVVIRPLVIETIPQYANDLVISSAGKVLLTTGQLTDAQAATVPTSGTINKMTASDVRSAVGLTTANLDTQLVGIGGIKAQTDKLQFTTGNDVKATLDSEEVVLTSAYDAAKTAASQANVDSAITANERITDIYASTGAMESSVIALPSAVKIEIETGANALLPVIKTQTDKMQFTVGNDIKSTLDGETVVLTTPIRNDLTTELGLINTNLDAKVSEAGGEVDLSGLDGKLDTIIADGAKTTDIPTPPTVEQIAEEILSSTGVTVGGTWTLAKLLKVLGAYAGGNVRQKTGSTTIVEILDVEDANTVVAEMTISASTPFKELNVL